MAEVLEAPNRGLFRPMIAFGSIISEKGMLYAVLADLVVVVHAVFVLFVVFGFWTVRSILVFEYGQWKCRSCGISTGFRLSLGF